MKRTNSSGSGNSKSGNRGSSGNSGTSITSTGNSPSSKTCDHSRPSVKVKKKKSYLLKLFEHLFGGHLSLIHFSHESTQSVTLCSSVRQLVRRELVTVISDPLNVLRAQTGRSDFFFGREKQRGLFANPLMDWSTPLT